MPAAFQIAYGRPMTGSLALSLKAVVGLSASFLGIYVSYMGLFAASWLQELNQYISQSVMAVTGVGCFFTALTIAVSNIKQFGKQHIQVNQNTEAIGKFVAQVEDLTRKLDLAEQARKELKEQAEREVKAAQVRAEQAERKAERAHALAHQIAQEATDKLAQAKADAEAKAARLENELREVRHATRDLGQAFQLEKDLRSAERSGEMPVVPPSGPPVDVRVTLVDARPEKGHEGEEGGGDAGTGP